MSHVACQPSPVVESIIADPVLKQCVRVRIADDVFVIDTEALSRIGIREQQPLSDEQYADIVDEADYIKAREKAVQLLTRKSYTVQEIRLRLKRYDIGEDVIERVINWLQRLQYVNDQRYAQQWVEQRMQLRGHGPLRLRQELQRKGVDRQYIDEALASFDDDDFIELAWNQGKKYVTRQLGDEEMTIRRKTYAYLQRRGYTASVIRRVMRRLEEQFLS